MTTTTTTPDAPAPAVEVASPFRMFAVTVSRVERVCESVLRVTFTGDDLDRFADNGFDQRIKFFLPMECGYGELLDLASTADWYGRWRELPDDRRHPIRTYTARGVRPHARELDVDIVLHGDGGPASRWARSARPGDELVVLGPNADAVGPHGGVDFVPPLLCVPAPAGVRKTRSCMKRRRFIACFTPSFLPPYSLTSIVGRPLASGAFASDMR